MIISKPPYSLKIKNENYEVDFGYTYPEQNKEFQSQNLIKVMAFTINGEVFQHLRTQGRFLIDKQFVYNDDEETLKRMEEEQYGFSQWMGDYSVYVKSVLTPDISLREMIKECFEFLKHRYETNRMDSELTGLLKLFNKLEEDYPELFI